MIARWTSPRVVSIRQPDWHSNLKFAPTPEQLRDDGSLDGIPIVTPDEVARRCAQQLREIAKHCSGYKAIKNNTRKSIPVRLVPVGGGETLEFPTTKAAAKEFGISEANVRAKLRRKNGVIAGYQWIFLAGNKA